MHVSGTARFFVFVEGCRITSQLESNCPHVRKRQKFFLFVCLFSRVKKQYRQIKFVFEEEATLDESQELPLPNESVHPPENKKK